MLSGPEWPTIAIRDITLRTGVWNPQTEPRDKICYVDVSAVSRETLEIDCADEIKGAKAPSRARKIIKKGDTIFATIRPSLKRVAQIPASYDDEIASTAFCVLRPDASVVDPDFLYFLVSSDAFVEEVANFETGASYPAVRDSDVFDREIKLPPVPYQRDIASALRAVRAATLHQSKSLAIAEELKRAAMRTLFTRGLRNEAQTETAVGPVPESWTVARLENLASFQRGFDITKSEQSSGSIPVISSGGIRSYHNVVGATGPGVVIGRKGSIGSLHYAETDYWPHDTTLWCTDFHGNLPKFVYFRLHVLDLKKLDSGAANPALNRNFLHDELISWPEVEEQHRIVAILDAIDRKIDLHKRKRAVLDELFKSLLHKLMTGEIHVADLDLSALGRAPVEGVAG